LDAQTRSDCRRWVRSCPAVCNHCSSLHRAPTGSRRRKVATIAGGTVTRPTRQRPATDPQSSRHTPCRASSMKVCRSVADSISFDLLWICCTTRIQRACNELYAESTTNRSTVHNNNNNNNDNNNNNNNNNRVYIAQVCRMTSEALDGQLQSCYTATARPKCLTEEKCF